MKKVIIWLMFLMILGSFVSGTVYNLIDCRTENCAGNFTCTGTNAKTYDIGGYINFSMGDSSDGCYFVTENTGGNDVWVVSLEKVKVVGTEALPRALCDDNSVIGTYCGGPNGYGTPFGYNTEYTPDRFYYYDDSIGENGYGNTFASGTWYNWTVLWDVTNDYSTIYINGTFQFNTNRIRTITNLTWVSWNDVTNSPGSTYSVQYVCIGDTQDECYDLISPCEDTTPPTISDLNCTSCVTDENASKAPYETEDTTPTFRFNTSEEAWCVIGVSDDKYTTMNTTQAGSCNSGEGLVGPHVCSLPVKDRFTSTGGHSIYISCIDSLGNEDTSSTSGELVMNILGASEAPGDDAIDIGIQTSEIAGCTVYSEQRVSARNLIGNQFSGIFDRVAVKENQRWAFNYVSDGEDDITGLFNISPVLYVLQLKNMTNESITDEVGKLINSTYP